jgi:hypothetical protein
MIENGIGKTLTDFGEKLNLIESRAKKTLTRFEVLRREAEFLKMEFLQRYLGERRKDIARSRGFTILLKDRRKVRDSLLVAAGSFILGGLISKDKFAALGAGMSGFDGVVQGLGETKWFVSLGKKILVAPAGNLLSDRTWFTWESIIAPIEELKKRALRGEQLGSLDDIIDNLKSIVSSAHPVWIMIPKQPGINKP